ncbi:hypothetical protein V7111_27085 [Neobacillus niacini]|uniref:hypothetical protein n=1 Tax=Neobacillus niacini TaxID=86668 RepID=UPI003001B3E4
MEWVKVIGLITVICFLGAIVQLLRFRKELNNSDKDQELTDELVKKWNKRLNWVIFFGVSGLIFSVISFIFRLLYILNERL